MYTRPCPRCSKSITYTHYSNYRRAERRKSVCKSCNTNSGRWVIGSTPHNKGIPFSDEVKQKMRMARIGRKTSDETKRKLRVAAVQDRLLKHGHAPNYNPTACKLIDAYGNANGLSFRHAENGGEVYLEELGYWLDGYDEKNNVVIEVYERRWHKDTERDERRKQEIVELLNCKFVEIVID